MTHYAPQSPGFQRRLRMERQRRLANDAEPMNLMALIEESVLDRPIGSTATMRAQLEYLIAMSE